MQRAMHIRIHTNTHGLQNYKKSARYKHRFTSFIIRTRINGEKRQYIIIISGKRRFFVFYFVLLQGNIYCNMKKLLVFALFLTAALNIGCGGRSNNNDDSKGHATKDLMLADDKTVKGLACDGCNDSVIWLYPGEGKDPVKYDIIDATRNKKVIGTIKVGDWIGIVTNPEDSTVADFVIDLDQLKGSWCYIVMPKFREYDQLSKKQQARMERDMPDSLKEKYLIPREYGFTLKRQFQASSIGYVPNASSLEAESPVIYPKMAYYFAWHILNGKIILSRYASDPPLNTEGKEKVKMPDVINDTIDVDYLSDDSLVLSSDGVSRSYYRISKATEANKMAREKAAKNAREALHSITEGSKASDNAGADKVNEKIKETKKK